VLYDFAYPDLPILSGKDDILRALKDHQALVVQGGTGSGKTTQLPKFLLEAGMAEMGLIGLTQPRRIAALSIADRLRQETGRADLIGAKIRFHEDLPSGTRVKVMTDGILLQEFRRDPLLRQYACIILDEAHERSLNVDILLGIFVGLLPRRPEFRLIVTSATLDADRFALYLGSAAASRTVAGWGDAGSAIAGSPAVPGQAAAGSTPGAPSPDGASKADAAPRVPVVEVEGRQYPVSLEYWDISGKDGDDADDDGAPARAFAPVEAAAIAIRELQARRPDNLLAFLPTEKEINELHRELERDLGNRFAILPLYSRLSPGDQKKVFADSDRPKIILATNIAETSLTIPGIGYVVDTGLARISRYHPHTKIQGLPIERISQASARQRAGRAGRVKPGVCVRLYSETDLNERIPFTEPEILRSNLANVVLHLLALGLDVDSFPFPDPPAPAALKGAFRQLHELGAVDGPGSDARLTAEGRRLSRLPVDVALGKILLKAEEYGVVQPALIIAAGITVQDARILPREEPDRQKAAALHKRFEDPRSDFLGVLGLWSWIHRNWGDRFTQRKLRALCLDNYLSYNRVREWMDLVDQFSRLLKVSLDQAPAKPEEAAADSLHKAILAGFLPFLGRRKPEDVSYRLAGDKEAHIHPGSALVKRKPEWIVAGEVRQTSRVYIYRAAEIKPAWVEEIAPDMCKRSYAQVAWNPERGFVEALERVTFKGFTLRADRRINYESVAPEECAELFWREGVIRDGAGAPFPFRDSNLKVLESLASLESKARARALTPDEDALAHWYRTRAPEVTSRVSLQRFLKEKGENALAFSLRDWTGGLEGTDWDVWTSPEAPPAPSPDALRGKAGSHPLHRMFPDSLRSGGREYRLSYRFDYGTPSDGITLETDPEGLAALSVPALFRGIPGWRKWIWDYVMERIGPKAAQAARPRLAESAAEWEKQFGAPPGEGIPASACVSPAAALSLAFAALPDFPGSGPAYPAVWPSHLQIHILVRSRTGRRFLLHADPSFGDCEFFAATRRLLFGENPSGRPWAGWAAAVTPDFGKVSPPLPWRGLHFGPDPLGAAPRSGSIAAGACAFFADAGEAEFHRGLGASPGAAGSGAAPDAKQRAALASFFAKRLQGLMDAWTCPDRLRKETAGLREFLCSSRLPDLFAGAYGAEALAQAEKALPPPRPAALPKPGAQVKSLAALGQSLTRAGESGTWALAALCFGSALVSRKGFCAWFRFLAQPPIEAKSAIGELVRKAASLPDWEELLTSPYYAACASLALADGLPAEFRSEAKAAAEQVSALSSLDMEGSSFPWRGDVEELAMTWRIARERPERIRKGAKALRDRFCARLTAMGQSVAGLPKDMRSALDALDRQVPWTHKAEAELELELYLNRAAGRSGGAAAAAPPESKPGTVAAERKDRLIQDLSGRFKKL